LNIANAKDIIHANAKYRTHAQFSIKLSHTLITHTGHDNEFNESFISAQFNDPKLLHKLHSAENVSFHCAQISFNHIHIALCTGYLIGSRLKVHEDAKAIPNTHLSAGQ
jgi:hypothetical protein